MDKRRQYACSVYAARGFAYICIKFQVHSDKTCCLGTFRFLLSGVYMYENTYDSITLIIVGLLKAAASLAENSREK